MKKKYSLPVPNLNQGFSNSVVKNKRTFFLIIVFFVFFGISALQAQINFTQSTLNFNGNGSVDGGVTSLMYGPDGKLYVAEYTGAIKIFTIQRNSANDYGVTAVETLDGILTMPDHNDDGTIHNSTFRETTGLTVGGTAANPIIYVSSSDFRIGAGSGGGNGDVGLDTNSGVITRFSWNGSSWDVVDLVRGLPRSEENHATNGLELVTINGTNYLLVAQGGHTNGGGPSENFVYTCEYALSAAVLSINLDAVNAMPILSDNGRNYIYDLPTLDDPTRANVNGITDPNAAGYNGIDVNDPFGGNDGLNQAVVVPGGPVQIFSPGYRNAFDLVVTESGALYVTDNGPNNGWGGFPVNEGTAAVTNAYDDNEPGSSSPSGGEQINNKDHLELVTTNLQTYTPGSFYGGHPNPTRANPTGAGLFTAPAAQGTAGAVFRTLTYDPDASTPGSTADASLALPANWPPVATANPVEGDWRDPAGPNPDGNNDNPITIWGTNTNAIDEYTASNFGGAMQGNLLAGHSGGIIRRVELKTDGTLEKLTLNFLQGIGGNALGITCNSDNDIFPGTIWTGTLNGQIVVFEPADAVVCLEPNDPAYNAAADYDSDGYTNQDEEDNDTDACNGGSQPSDYDKVVGGTLVSDLNDTDDDADGILDANDPFQLGDVSTTGSDAFELPIRNDLFNDQQGLGGVFGLGMTGLMNNGNTAANWLDWIDKRGQGPNPDDVLGGAPGLMTSHMTSGTALGASNSQEKGYQYGVQTNMSTGIFEVTGNLVNLTGALRLYGNTAAVGGELGHFIGDGTQSNYIKVVLTTQGITALQEINDVPQSPINVAIAEADRPNNSINFYFVVDPANGMVTLEYAIDNGARNTIGTIAAQGSILNAIQQTNKDLAVGFIGTSNTPGVELEGTWDFLNVLPIKPIVSEELPDLTRIVNASNEVINLNDFFDDNNSADNLTYTLVSNSNSAIGASITGDNLTLSFPATGTSTITVRATDDDMLTADQSFEVTVTDQAVVLYRVNCGGSEIAAIDDGINWEADTVAENSDYLSVAGSNKVFLSGNIPVDSSVDQSTTPLGIYASERYDDVAGAPNVTYSFPVNQSGNYEVRLYMANSFSGTAQPGSRIFDAEIEGAVLPLLDDIDLSATYGHQTGTVITHTLKVTDGTIDIKLLHGDIENPLINAIEILDAPDNQTPIYVHPIAQQFNNPGQQLNGSLAVNAVGGDGNLQYAAAGLPPGVIIEPTNGQIGGTISSGAASGSPYTVTITVNDSDSSNDDSTSITFEWVIGSNVWVDKDENENYTARHECSLVQAGNKFYLMGGRENAKTVDVYDYTSNTWTNLTNSAPFPFNHFQATEYQGLIWVVAAFKTNSFPNETSTDFIWMFNPATNEWIKGPAIPAARKRGATGMVVYNDKFYIVGGNTDGHDGGYVPWFDEYDPATGVWTALVDAPHARDHFSTVVIGNNLYVAGGRLSGGPGGVFAPTVPEVDVYNFTSGTWTTLPAGQNIPTPRGGASTAVFNGKLLVIGGEVENQDVYGVNTTGALKVTEEYDPATQTWSRVDDLNHQRHGTQAIVSNQGVFILGGSPTLGGGNQKNMEYLGLDQPTGDPSVASDLGVPLNVLIADGATENFDITTQGGNVGVFVTSMELSGPNASDFSILTGELTNQLLSANATHNIAVNLTGTGDNRSATLTITYGNGATKVVNLTNFDNNLSLTNPGNQNNNEGDTVSLQIEANGASNYSATGLPPTLTINPTTGLITGTVSTGNSNVGPFQEQNGLVVIEAESGNLTPSWTEVTYGGATGIVAGSNNFSNQNGGTIPYQISITTPGVYRVNWRSLFNGPDATEENDNWLRFPNNNDVWFFGYKGTPADEASLIANVQSANPTNVVFPKGSNRITANTTPEGNGSNGYFKIYRSGGSSQVYDWQAKTSDNDPHDIYVWFANAGTYTMEISERSAGHAIDKVALYKVDGPNYSDAQLTAAAESTRASGAGAADGSPYNVTITATDNDTPPTTINTQFTWAIGEVGDPIPEVTAMPTVGFIPLEVTFTGSDSTDDNQITSYLWDFKDGTPTVTDPDPMHTFTVAGTYEVELTVGDNEGNTTTTTVTIVASEPGGDVRINAGGDAYSFEGTNWAMDDHFNGGGIFEREIPIANTANDELYQTERFSTAGILTYEIPVVDGVYNVNLHFAELYFGLPGLGADGGEGSRVFNINIENGQTQINNYDIFVKAGGSATAVVENIEGITVNDGNLTITLTGVVENPKISGIELIVPGQNLAPVVYAGEDVTVAVQSGPITLDGSALDPDGGSITSYGWSQVSGPNMATFSSNMVEDPVVSNLIEGSYVFKLTATDGEGTTGFDEVTVIVADIPPSTIFINSGGPSLTFGDEEWIMDQYYNQGNAFEKDIAIANTENDELYQTERFNSGSLIYQIPVDAAGNYNVDLHFAELYFGLPGFGEDGGAGSRVFDIDIENGQVEVDNYDIFVTAGGPATAVIESYKGISVTDGSLTITLTGVVENPKISGIGVFETRVPIVNAGEDQMITLPVNSIALNGSANDPDGGMINYAWSQVNGPNTATLSGETTENLTASNLVEGVYVFKLTAVDDETQMGTDEVTVTVSADNSNEAPDAIAEATPLSGAAPLNVAFTGSNSTDDVGVIFYAWDFKDGTTSTEADPNHTFTASGTYNVELAVTDGGGLTDTAVVTIVVSDTVDNEAPIAIVMATPTNGTAPLEVAFTGANSTDDNGIVSYLWDFKDGSTATEMNPSHTFTSSGTYNVQLTVTDGAGLTGSAIVTIVVSDQMGNQAPNAIAEATPMNGIAPLEVSFNGANSTDDVGVVSYLWDFKDGTTSTEMNPVHTFTTSGTYNVQLTVTDDGGLTDIATVAIVVGEVTNEAPNAVVTATPEEGMVPLEVAFTGSNSTDDIGVVSYLWDFKDGTTSTEMNPSHTFTTAGSYNVQLTVTDAGGLTDTAMITIVVANNSEEKVSFVFETNPPSPTRGGVAVINSINKPSNVEVLNITLHDISGRYINGYLAGDVLVGDHYEIPIVTLEDGFYLVRVVLSEGDSYLLKLLIRN